MINSLKKQKQKKHYEQYCM